MKINIYKSWQIGLMIDFGTTYDKIKYVCLEIPFLTIQFSIEPKNQNK